MTELERQLNEDLKHQVHGWLTSQLVHAQAVYACGLRPSRWIKIGQRRSGLGAIWLTPEGEPVFLRPPYRKRYPRSVRKRLKAQVIHELGKIQWARWQREIRR